MTPVVDLIGTIVARLKPSITADAVSMERGGGVDYVPVSASGLRKLFIGERVKFTFAEGVYYCKIATIDYAANTFTVDLTTDGFASTPTAVEIVLNYHHGHPLEIIDLFKQATHSDTVKYEQFPAICLFQDIPEKHSTFTVQREASLNIVILTDTKKDYEANDRYTYTFIPTLIPLYEAFIEELKCSEVQILNENYDYFERLYWGKSGLYGNQANIFNDFIDAIEINNLKIRIL